jgi:hypothetical protein
LRLSSLPSRRQVVFSQVNSVNRQERIFDRLPLAALREDNRRNTAAAQDFNSATMLIGETRHRFSWSPRFNVSVTADGNRFAGRSATPISRRTAAGG